MRKEKILLNSEMKNFKKWEMEFLNRISENHYEWFTKEFYYELKIISQTKENSCTKK